MNQATDIVREHFQQDFVYLRDSRLAAHRVPEYALDRGERRLDIRPLVIRLQKLFAVQDEIRKQFVPRPRWRRSDRIALKRDERLSALTDRQFQIRVGTVRLVAEYSRDIELIHRFRNERRKERSILRVASVTCTAVTTFVFTPQTAWTLTQSCSRRTFSARTFLAARVRPVAC